MTLDRRRLLATAVAGSAAALLPWRPAAGASAAGPDPGADTGASRRALPELSGTASWERIRAEFDLAPDWIHLGCFYLVSHPRMVREAVDRYSRALDANPLSIEELFESAHADDNLATRAKVALAGYLGARREEIALTPNTTTGLALLYNGLRIRADQEILTTEHDHYVHHESIRYSVERSGAGVRFVALHDFPAGAAQASAAEMVERLRRAITPRTRAVGLTWVHSATGLKLPIPALAEVVAQANSGRDEGDRCLLIVDGVHGFGVENADAATLGADFFVASAHKWLFAPRGTGLVWGRPEAWLAIRPTIPSFDPDGGPAFDAWLGRTALPPTRAAFVSPGGFTAYEHQFAIADAIQFHRTIGRARITSRIHKLNSRIRRGLAEIRGVTVHTPGATALAGGIVCFEVAGLTPEAVVAKLAQRRIHATASPYKHSYARLAAGIMNHEEEIDTALAAVRELARA